MVFKLYFKRIEIVVKLIGIELHWLYLFIDLHRICLLALFNLINAIKHRIKYILMFLTLLKHLPLKLMLKARSIILVFLSLTARWFYRLRDHWVILLLVRSVCLSLLFRCFFIIIIISVSALIFLLELLFNLHQFLINNSSNWLFLRFFNWFLNWFFIGLILLFIRLTRFLLLYFPSILLFKNRSHLFLLFLIIHLLVITFLICIRALLVFINISFSAVPRLVEGWEVDLVGEVHRLLERLNDLAMLPEHLVVEPHKCLQVFIPVDEGAQSCIQLHLDSRVNIHPLDVILFQLVLRIWLTLHLALYFLNRKLCLRISHALAGVHLNLQLRLDVITVEGVPLEITVYICWLKRLLKGIRKTMLDELRWISFNLIAFLVTLQVFILARDSRVRLLALRVIQLGLRLLAFI